MTQDVAAPVSTTGEQPTSNRVCTLYVVRHGTTTMNVENRYRGRCDVPLDAQGYQDAVDAARQLSHLGLAAVYTGGLRRTIATAQIIADEARIPDIRVMHGLINVDYGAWEGLTAQEAEIYDPVAFKLYKTSPSQAVCPNGERLRDAQKRMLEALSIIAARHEGERVAVISHAVMIRLAVAALEHTEGEQWRIPVGRGSYTAMGAQDGRLWLQQLPAGTDVD
jgi:broad specificity phosphatase PhoE